MDQGPFRSRRADNRPPAGRPEPAPVPQPKEEPAVVQPTPAPEPVVHSERPLPKPEPIVATNTHRHSANKRKESPVKAFSQYKHLASKWALPGISAIAVIAIVIAVIFGISLSKGGASGINKKEYQAVFLQNGQDYFGKLTVLNSGYFKLTDVYYLQSSTSSTSSSSSSSSSNDSTLIKLGSEIHAPEDEMIIAKDQVLFYENIKSSGKVAQAIAQYQKQNK